MHALSRQAIMFAFTEAIAGSVYFELSGEQKAVSFAHQLISIGSRVGAWYASREAPGYVFTCKQEERV